MTARRAPTDATRFRRGADLPLFTTTTAPTAHYFAPARQDFSNLVAAGTKAKRGKIWAHPQGSGLSPPKPEPHFRPARGRFRFHIGNPATCRSGQKPQGFGPLARNDDHPMRIILHGTETIECPKSRGGKVYHFSTFLPRSDSAVSRITHIREPGRILSLFAIRWNRMAIRIAPRQPGPTRPTPDCDGIVRLPVTTPGRGETG